MELPKEVQIGGQVLKTQICEELGGSLGKCCCYNGYIKIATNVDGCTQTESSMLNTYIHEFTHAILDTMGRGDLSQDEKFVSTFAGFATEGIVSILKQGKKKSIWHNEDEEPQRGSLILLIMQSGTPIVAKIIEPNHTFNHGERWAYIDDLLEKRGEKPKKVSIWKHWKDGICGNSEGKPIYLIKNGNTYSISSCLGYECDYIELSDLDELMLQEKQGNLADKVEPTDYNSIDPHFAKPTDKIETKFHEGDWVVVSTAGGDKVVQIDSVEYFKDGHPSYFTTEGRWFGNGTKARLLTDKDMETITIPESKVIVKQKHTDLEEFINELSKQFPDVSFAKLSRIAVRVAKWAKPADSHW